MTRNKEVRDMSIYEASDFWDEHDFFEFNDIVEIGDMKFSASKKKYIGIDMDVYKKVRKEAHRLKKSEDALISEWLKEKVSLVKG
jgi:hypothetical protein